MAQVAVVEGYCNRHGGFAYRRKWTSSMHSSIITTCPECDKALEEVEIICPKCNHTFSRTPSGIDAHGESAAEAGDTLKDEVVIVDDKVEEKPPVEEPVSEEVSEEKEAVEEPTEEVPAEETVKVVEDIVETTDETTEPEVVLPDSAPKKTRSFGK